MDYCTQAKMNNRLYELLRAHFELIVLGQPASKSQYAKPYITFAIGYEPVIDDPEILLKICDTLAESIIKFAGPEKILVVRHDIRNFNTTEHERTVLKIRAHTLPGKNDLIAVYK